METTPEKSHQERRHHQRVVFNGTATLHGPVAETTVRTRNISVGGISLLSQQDVALESRCVVITEIPSKAGGTTRVELKGRVVNSMFNKIEGGYMLGLEFFNLTASVAATIARFMQGR